MLPRMVIRGGCVGLLLLFLAGCDTFFSQKPTEIQTNQIIYDLSKVNIVSGLDRPYPPIYTAEPKVVTEGDTTTLFYFTRNQPTKILADLITQQYGYAVSEIHSTNQLVIACKKEEQVENLLAFLNNVDVPPIQIKIDCLISEIFADVTMDYETTSDILDLFGEDMTIQSFLPGASVRGPRRSNFGMKAGISRSDFDFLIDILVSRGYAKILMRPSLEVVNGTTARIETTERVPIREAILSGGDIVETIVYHAVTDYLEVTPYVYTDGTIGLKTKAGIASRTIPEGVDQAPIITTRNVNSEENRLHKGRSLIIGGIRKTERVSVIRGVPFLKDVPFLGVLFSSKDFEDRAKEILFILTPSISGYGVDTQDILDDIEEKHAKPEYQHLLEGILDDPFAPKASEYSLPEDKTLNE
jgi:type II secretory pathway component GspD/PulD (secretin)